MLYNFRKLSEFLGVTKSQKVILLYSTIITIFIVILNQSWMYNRPGVLDQAVYLGAAVYFPEVLKLFPDSVVIELVPTYLLNLFFYRLFSPLWANFIRDFIYLNAFLFMFLSICEFLTQDFLASLITTIIFGGYYYFLATLGSDYTDSPIQLLYIAQLYIIFLSIYNVKLRQDNLKIAFILGVLSALMLSTAVLSLVHICSILLLIVILYISLSPTLVSINSREIFLLIKYIASWLAGFLSIVIITSIYLYISVGGFFMYRNFLKLFFYLSEGRTYPSLIEWAQYAGWLVIPVSLFIVSLYIVLYNRHETFVFFRARLANYFNFKSHTIFNSNYIPSVSEPVFSINKKPWFRGESSLFSGGRQSALQVSFIFYVLFVSFSLLFIQLFAKQWSLQFFYFSQVNFIYYLLLAIFIHKGLSTETEIGRILALFVAIGMVAFNLKINSYRILNFEMLATGFFTTAPSIVPWLILLVFFSLVIYLYLIRVISTIFLVIFIIIFHVFSYSELHGGSCCLDSMRMSYLGDKGTSSEKIFLAAFKLSSYLDKLDKNRTMDIWFDETERFGGIYRQVYSMTYFNLPKSIINKKLPALGDYSGPPGSEGHEPLIDKKIIMISEDKDKLLMAISNLSNQLHSRFSYQFHELPIGNATLLICEVQKKMLQ